MNVVWTELAENELDRIANYILDEFGAPNRTKFLKRMLDTANLLEESPYIGIKEPLLSNRKSEYRSIKVGKLNRIVYRIIDGYIEISDIWELRRNPDILANRIK